MTRDAVKNKVFFTLERLPLATIVGLAGFSVPTIVFLLLGQFKAEYVWSAGIMAAASCVWVLMRYVPRTNIIQKPAVICDILVLLGVLAWGGGNALFASQHIITDRDPATYAVTSAWLATHQDFKVPAGLEEDVAELHKKSAGFTLKKDGDGGLVLHPQAQHLLPSLLGAVGKFFGQVDILKLNVLFGMTALLAMYSFGRLVVRPYWAMIATAVIAGSLPLVYFSRDMYTEPLAMTFIFGGLALLWLAQQSKKTILWGLAGLVSGASLLVRIDGYLPLIGLAAFFAVYLTLGGARRSRDRIKHTLAFWMPVAVMALLAWADLVLYSEAYYLASKKLIVYGIAAPVVLLIFGGVGYAVARKYKGLIAWCDRATKNWRHITALGIVLLLGAFFASRPAWFQPLGERQNEIVAAIQEQQQYGVEPRTYAELAPYWISWYVGPVLTALGLAGLGVVAYRVMRDKKIMLLPLFAVVAGTCLVYFMAPGITPDQPWASRRMLPVAMPGIALLGVLATSLLIDRLAFPSVIVRRFVLAGVTACFVLAPLVVSASFVVKPTKTYYPIIGDACKALPSNSVVVFVGMARLNMVQPMQTFCGVEAYNFLKEGGVDKPSQEDMENIAREARAKGKLPVVGVYRDQYGGYIDENEQTHLTEMPQVTFYDIVPTLKTPPKAKVMKERHLSLGVINKDGSFSPLK